MKRSIKHKIYNRTSEIRFDLLVMIVISVFCLSLSSCQENKRKENIEKVIKEWAGKEIKFSEKLFCTYMGNDTTCVDLTAKIYKILIYVDSIGCTSCRLNLNQWSKFILESDTAFIKKPEFLFFFQPKNKGEKDIILTLREYRFRHTVFIDKENETYKLNKFPANSNFQCFLLDKDNKVLLVGDPTSNPNIWILFKRIIKEREVSEFTTKKGGKFTSLLGKSTYFATILTKKESRQKNTLN